MAHLFEDSVLINGNNVGASYNAPSLNITAAGSTTLSIPSGVGSMFITIGFTGTGYTHNITLPVNDALGNPIPNGFSVQILASIPAASNIVVNYIDGVSSTTSISLTADQSINPLPVIWFVKTGNWDWKIGGGMPYQKVVWANTDLELRNYLGITAVTDALQAEIDVWTELKLNANVTNSTITPTAITGLATTVIPNCTHRLEYTILFSSTALNSGLGLTLQTPNGATGSFALATRIPIAVDGTAAEFQGTINSFGDVVLSTAVPVANALYIAQIVGIFNCSTGGTIQPAFRSEIAGQTITIYAGSVVLDRVFP